MKSSHAGIGTSAVEVLNISPHGLWLYVKGKEYFLPYTEFPWFKEARVDDVHRVRLLRGHHLRWDELDVDVEVEALAHPERYPLKYQ